MAVFQQLKLLLWKNGLNIIRKPVWSLTLIFWPVVIFIIIAVTRSHFPPILKDSCYVEPRNLPSAGFFPFLQTLMCNKDSKCHNRSLQVSPSTLTKRSTGDARSTVSSGGSLLAKMLDGGDFYSFTFSNDSNKNTVLLTEALDSLWGMTYQHRNTSVIRTRNSSFTGDEGALNQTMESVKLLKQAICAIALAAINRTSPSPFGNDVMTFCISDNPVFEDLLQSLNQMLKEELLTNPDELAKVAGAVVLVFQELQNQSSLWESLLAFPQLFSEGSLDQMLGITEVFLTNIQTFMNVIQTNFPGTAESVTPVHPLIAGAINIIHYVQRWPGRDVSLPLGDVVKLHNNSFDYLIEPVLQNVRIPLVQVMALTLNRDIVHSYICDDGSNPSWLTTACATGIVDMLLQCVSRSRLAQQALLAWSKHVAPHDVSFAKGLLHSLMGDGSPGAMRGFSISRTRRNLETHMQNTEEELFLRVGQVVLEISEIDPDLEMIVQSIVSVGFQSIRITSLSVDIVGEIMHRVLSDASRLQNIVVTLLTNQTKASLWIDGVRHSAVEVIMKILASESPTCEDILNPFQWLLSTETITFEMWKAIICQDNNTLEHLLLMDWMPLKEKAFELYSTFTKEGGDYNVTLPMVLDEWHKLCNSTLEFVGAFLDRPSFDLGEDYWSDWIPGNISDDIVETLQKSLFAFMVNLGEKVQASPLWPELKSYFHIIYWVFNYTPGVTTQPANCSLDIETLNIDCDTGLNWKKLVQGFIEALMFPKQNILVNYLKGAVSLLQTVFGDLIMDLTASYLTQEINGGDALSAYLINLMDDLQHFVYNISALSNQDISDPDVLVPLFSNLLESTGLSPLLPFLFSDSLVNVSDIIDAAVKLGRDNQHIFTFNETDPAMPELERLIMQFLSLERNLTMSLSYVLGNTLLTYSNYFDPGEVARVRESLKPFTNQTSSGIVEAILTAMELLKEAVESPNDDPAAVILSYIRQLQEFAVSLFRLRRIQHTMFPDGQPSTTEITDLFQVSTDFLNLLTPESLYNLTQIGPDAAQELVIQKFLAFLPPEFQEEAAFFFQNFKALRYHLSVCAALPNCSAPISEVFTFLDQMSNLMLSANGSVTVNVALTNTLLERGEYEDIAFAFLLLLLSPNDTAYVDVFNQTLHFLRLVIETPNITVSQIQNALRQSNVTLEDLNYIAHLAGSANINDLFVNIMGIANVAKCFEVQHNTSVTAQCVMGLIDKVSNFLKTIPALHNHTDIISLIPLIVNETTTDVIQANFSSNTHMTVLHALNNTLNNVKINLHLNNLSTPEIMNEIRVIEGLFEIAADPEPLNHIFNAMSVTYSEEVTKIYLQVMQWYLQRLENVTSSSVVSDLLYPLFRLTQLQVTLQLAQTNLTLFINNQIHHFVHPTDGAGVSKIGQATIEILQQIVKYTIVNIQVQNENAEIIGSTHLFNTTKLHELEQLIQIHLDVIHTWMKEPNVTAVFTSMLQWGNSSLNVPTPVKDIHLLLRTLFNYLSDDHLTYLSIINNVTQSLSNAIVILEQPGDVQFDNLYATIMESVQTLMNNLTQTTGPLPHSVQQDIEWIVHDTLALFVRTDLSYATSLNLTLLILKRAENVVQHIVPDEFAVYLLSGLKVTTTYFETVASTSGPDNWNDIILNQMKTVQSLLPLNSTAQYYVSVLINITHLIVGSDQGNNGFANDTIEIITGILGQIWQIMAHEPGTPSLGVFMHFAPVLEQIVTGKADGTTWHKLEKMLEALLSTLSESDIWDNVTAVVPYFEKTAAFMVNNTNAENLLILSLQKPLMTLMTEIAQSVNSSHLNLSEISERMQPAIENTLLAAEQANGTLQCSEALKAWAPVGAAAGLNQIVLEMWCDISLQPVLEAYAACHHMYPHLNTGHSDVTEMTAGTAASRIANATRSLYQVKRNQSHAMEQVIMAVTTQLTGLLGQPLFPSAKLSLYKQLQDRQLQNRLSSIQMLSDKLLTEAPMLWSCVDAMERALNHILNNSHHLQESDTSQAVFREAAIILLSCANITSEDGLSLMEGDLSWLSNGSRFDTRNALQTLIHMTVFGNESMIYQVLEDFVASDAATLLMQKVAEISAWLASREASGLELLTEALPKILELLKPLLSILAQIGVDMPESPDLVGDLAENIIAMLRQLLSSGLFTPMDNPPWGDVQDRGNSSRHRREAPMIPQRGAVDDFLDLLHIDYPAMFRAISAPLTPEEMMATAHVCFANPDLNIVIKETTKDMPWALNSSGENTIDAVLGALSFFTLPSYSHMSYLDLLRDAVALFPDSFPYASALKNITKLLASESQENLYHLKEFFQTAAVLFQTNIRDPLFTERLNLLRSQACMVENAASLRYLLQVLSLEPGQLCHTILPGLETLLQGLLVNTTDLNDALFQTIIGDPSTFDQRTDWSAVFTQSLGFNTSTLASLGINVTSSGETTVGELLRNQSAFIQDVQQHMDFDPAALDTLLETVMPNKNLKILSCLMKMRHCDSPERLSIAAPDVFKTFCSMSSRDWYTFSVLLTRHLNLPKFIYRMVLSDEVQSLLGLMLQMAMNIIHLMDRFLPAIDELQSYMLSIESLNLVADNEFNQMARGMKQSLSVRATFVTISRAMCSQGVMALFGLADLPIRVDPNPFFLDRQKREEMIDRFKIPRNATPFCMSMYLDMVSTTGGAIAWAFIKPMLMGKILFTPNTPITRAVMEKANGTLQEFANLKRHSEKWIQSSDYIMESAKILSHTLPLLKSSLSNPFVQNFIEMQTDIDVNNMRNTLNSFSNVTLMLEKNKHIMKQITILSTLLVNISSCIKFDRYQGYDSAEQLDVDAQELAKDRNLYGSVIFTLPKEENSLPPRVSYTIRMHMDNVMRTDRVRNPYFVKDTHISAKNTMRYNRGFVYLQENIDRAIIEYQTGQRVTDTAVQLQPFPYPCYLRDEYLEAISFVFPIMLMLAWVLFVADFVKKLVHEKELRLHEYMKMMGVNPLSHFFAWFLECAVHLMVTIVILTLVLKCGGILSHSDGFLLFLYLSDYGLSILAFSFLLSSFFDKTYIAALSSSLLYILCFFPYIVVIAMETSLTLFQKSALSLLSPSCFSYASQYISRYESQGEGIQWSNSYLSPIAGDTASFGWLCWLMLIDSIIYFVLGAYIRMVFPGSYGIPAPWYFPFTASFWDDLWCCVKPQRAGRGLLVTNIMTKNPPVFDNKGKGQSALSSQGGEDFSHLPVGVALHGLTKIYGDRVAIQNLNLSFHEGHVTSLLGHNGAGKTTTMSLLTGLFAPSSGTIEVYGRDMQTNLDDIRRELGVCMQYDVLFDHMTTKEHLLLYGQIKAPHWSRRELREQVRTILEETGMYAQRHKRVVALSGGMKRKLSISIAFIGDSRLVVLDEPTTGVDPCSRRSIWDIVLQHKKRHTIIMSTHHLDEAEVLSDRIAFLQRGGLKCCGSPVYLKEKLGQGYKLTLTKKKKTSDTESERFDDAEMKAFIQAHVPEARLKEAHGSDQVYTLPPFTSSHASAYRSLLIALDANLDDLQLEGYGISDTTLEEVFLQLTDGNEQKDVPEDRPFSISQTVSDSESLNSFSADPSGSMPPFSDKINLMSSSKAQGMGLAWQQIKAMMIKRFHHSRRDYKGLISQILLPVLFVVFAMGLGSIKSDLQHYPKLELSPALYNIKPSYAFFSKHNESSSALVDEMMSYPGMDNSCLDESGNPVCMRQTGSWESRGKSSEEFSRCKCTLQEQVCHGERFNPPSQQTPSSQIVYNLSGINVENYLLVTANDFIRNRYGGFEFGLKLPSDLQMDLIAKSANATLSKVWFNPEGHHTMPAYLNSLNNFILRANLPADKEPHKYAISVSSHPYFGRADDEDAVVQGMLQILVAICVLTGYSITTASFAVYVVSEHHNGSKRLQHIAGISEPFYWAATFLYDMIIYMVPVALTVGVVAAFQIPAFTERQNLAAVTLLLVLFGFATFPWMYLLSGVFKDAETAFIIYVCINLFISTNTIMSSSILYFLGQVSTLNSESIKETFRIMSQVFLIFPQFNFGNGLMHLARKNIEVQLLSGYGIDAYINPLSTDALGWMIISSVIQGVVFFALRLLLNRFLLRKVGHLILGRKKVSEVIEDEDKDVAAERLRMVSGAADSDILQVNQLTKIYQHLNKTIYAVKRLSVGIPAGECFGLLGVNGAGKTTTFKMLTGDVSPTDGTAQIRDWDGRLVDIMECRHKGINIGYCPQVDALDNLLTGEEHLYFYARIRGISKSELDGVVQYLLKKLELNYHQNMTTEGYSCGTRRKLSTAIALIGHPQILLLDEPSSGMDPRTKRRLWKIISEEVKGKCAVVLTSHSMEECEALCSRLAIMVKGQFRCLGSLQHIKNRFGRGFTVKMYLAEATSDVAAITSFMQRHFPSTYLKDQHSSMVEYHVPVATGGVAAIFDKLECSKRSLQIKHFSVSQTTLDEVFINFAMGNSRMESIATHDDFDSIKDAEA